MTKTTRVELSEVVRQIVEDPKIRNNKEQISLRIMYAYELGKRDQCVENLEMLQKSQRG